MKNIQVFDTTLRDGAQTPGVNMTPDMKVAIAKQLDEFGVDMIEAGFAISSPGDFRAIREISENVKARVFSLARLNFADIDASSEALKNSKNRGIHTFIGTSPMHREFKLRMTQEEIIAEILDKVAYARNKFNKDTDLIMFSPEDALRTEYEFLLHAIEKAINAGANAINVPDTVGFSQPFEIYELFRKLTEEFPNVDFSVHNHNDLGNAVANSLAALKGGANIVQGTIPPAFGERAGNADLIQVLMNIIKRPDIYGFDIYGFDINDKIDMKKASDLVQFISNNIGKRVPTNYPVVGRDVFRHSSGIHQHGTKKNKSTYEIIDPEEIGYRTEQSFILTNQSGKAGLKNAIKVYFGKDLDDDTLEEINTKFKEITSANSGVVVTMDDVKEILISSGIEIKRNIVVDKYMITLDNYRGKAAITLQINGDEHTSLIEGVGPVDAVYKSILKATNMENEVNLIDFSIGALSSSPSSEAEVYIKIEHKGRIYEEFGVDQDIVKASIKAFVNCLDRIKNN